MQSSMSIDALAALGASRKTKLFARWARSHNDSQEISLLLYMNNSNTFLWIQEEFFTMARWPCQPRHGKSVCINNRLLFDLPTFNVVFD